MQIWNMKMKMGYNKSDIRGSAEPFCEGAPSHSRQLYGRTSIIFLTDFIASAKRPNTRPPSPPVRFLITERRLISMVRKVTWYAFEKVEKSKFADCFLERTRILYPFFIPLGSLVGQKLSSSDAFSNFSIFMKWCLYKNWCVKYSDSLKRWWASIAFSKM